MPEQKLDNVTYLDVGQKVRRDRIKAATALVVASSLGLVYWAFNQGDNHSNVRQPVQIETPNAFPEAPPAEPILVTPQEMDEFFGPHSPAGPES